MPASFSCATCGAAMNADAHACGHCGTAAARRRCGVCFDLNLASDRNCRRCGRVLPEARTVARMGAVACPGCADGMTARDLSGLPFDECERCGGLWLSPSILEQVKEEGEARARLRAVDVEPHGPSSRRSKRPPSEAAASAVAYRRCPSCRKMMNRSNLASGSGFVVDVCKDHGVYFDHGELTRLFAFIESGGLQKARRREEEALRQRVRDARREAIRIAASGDGIGSPEPPSALELIARLAGGWLRG